MGLNPAADPERLQRRLDELESRVRALRLSRRVLLDLLHRVQSQHRRRIDDLEAEVNRLRTRNRAYALRLWKQNGLLAAGAVEPAARGRCTAGTGASQSKE